MRGALSPLGECSKGFTYTRPNSLIGLEDLYRTLCEPTPLLPRSRVQANLPTTDRVKGRASRNPPKAKPHFLHFPTRSHCNSPTAETRPKRPHTAKFRQTRTTTPTLDHVQSPMPPRPPLIQLPRPTANTHGRPTDSLDQGAGSAQACTARCAR